MARDHFIAQTYLKHFGDAALGGMLHAYRKTDGKTFECWPKDICHEWDGDFNSMITHRPELLGDYRKIFEPHWNPAVENILKGKITATDKFVVAAYMANMMVCTPAWRRVGQTVIGQQMTARFLFEQEMNAKHGTADKELAEAAESVKRGEIAVELDPRFVKALTTRQLLEFACVAFNRDWLVVENETGQPFLTSDNPVVLAYSAQPGDSVTRMLPITPTLCLSISYQPGNARRFNLEDVARVLASPPEGVIMRAKAKPAGVSSVNQLIAQCAEEVVFSPAAEEGIADLVRKYANHRVDCEFVEFPAEELDARYMGATVCVREVKGRASS